MLVHPQKFLGMGRSLNFVRKKLIGRLAIFQRVIICSTLNKLLKCQRPPTEKLLLFFFNSFFILVPEAACIAILSTEIFC